MTSTINLIIYAESAQGLLRLEDICQKAVELSKLGSGVQLQGIVFGSDDFCASIGEWAGREDVVGAIYNIYLK